MNLGDGLTFQLEDGKPKLILSTYGVQSKGSKKTATRTRPQNVLIKPKQGSEEPVADQSQRTREKMVDSRKSIVTETAAVGRKEPVGSKAQGKFASKADPSANANSRAQAPARAGSARKTGVNKQAAGRGPSKLSADALKESLVCLTQDQLQQILSTINQASASSPQDPGQPKPAAGEDSPVSEAAAEGTASEAPPSARSDGARRAQGERVMANGAPAGLFSTLGEREREKEALEARRAQWKKGLDEQMAQRLQQKKTAASSLDYSPWAGRTARDPDSKPSSEMGEEERLGGAVSGLEERTRSSALSYSSQQDLPTAIRSAFILGEASPLEHPFSAQRQEQQRRWLQALEEQREENKLRRQQEKRELSQAEDHERWAMHFDSLQKRVPSQPAQGPDTPAGPATQQLSPSGALSVAPGGPSPLGGELLGTSRGTPPRASHLRTMTSLLDPAQIEDRERKRLKQLEHQRAIQAQVEERRRQREQEEAQRRAREREEEQRLEREREELQEQYQLDALRDREKKEQQAQRTEELYRSVQRARQEAAREKQEQKLRRLTRRGHDVSNLLQGLEEDCPTPAGLDSRGTSSLALGRVDLDVLVEEAANESQRPDALSSRRDASVQTDVGRASAGVAVATGGRSSETPDVPAEFRPPAGGRRPGREAGGPGKENVGARAPEDGPYEPFARRPRPAPGPGGRPQWNTHRPGKAFVPASERYPSGLRRDRQDSRLRRQTQLLTLVERNAPSRPGLREPGQREPGQRDPGQREPRPPAHSQPGRKTLPHTQEEHISRSSPHSTPAAHVENRGCSPPVPAVKHRLQQQAPQGPVDADERPSSSPFVPYLRTDEVYQLDPLAPLSRPPTQGSQQPGADAGRPTPPPSDRDPLLNPELLKNKERQQAILRGLSELRQGLMQKQRELETGLNPLLLGQEGRLSPLYQHTPPL
ncbi:coiled-coil domain-containing protein 66 [Conger conger]|uniref:coiled-coil domain-containing protein 66 n=1 Tax=Conger conger TaxID=82655 RepID=UPI002A59F641|nr:coiled-coil domain-containing protein 66 [Conger conger]